MKYRNEDDRCYGVAGMAIGLNIFDASQLYSGITLDGGSGLDCIQFTPDFYFAGNPRYDAKDSWQLVMSHFQVVMGLVIADAVCRKMLRDHGAVDRKMRKRLLAVALDEGREMCQLEADEVEPMFDRYFEHITRVFSNHDIRRATVQLVKQLKQQRSFTSSELADLLQELEII